MSHQPAKGPTQQIVRSGALHPANKAQVVGGHVLDRIGECVSLNETARLQAINWMPRWDVADEPRIRPADSGGWVNAEQRPQAPAAPNRHQSLKIGPV